MNDMVEYLTRRIHMKRIGVKAKRLDIALISS